MKPSLYEASIGDKRMKWQCPNHKTVVYDEPGRCVLCQTPTEPVPTMPKLVELILSDKDTLRITLKLVDIIAKAVFNK